jgi:glycine hydroxymethyltransferase
MSKPAFKEPSAMTKTASDLFTQTLAQTDPEIANAIEQELERQHYQIEMIASENLTSNAVMAAQGSIMTNKYAEGYPGKRYYGGCEFVDIAENLAIERACQLFNCSFANVQPNSGSQANQAVYLALLQPGDTILGMSLNSGGHLTHGSAPNLSGKWFNAVGYDVDPETYLIDYDALEKLALEHQPKMIIAGASAYPRQIDFARMRTIADKVGAYLMADVAHYAGLIAANVYPSPFPHAHVATTTTHKTLRGPRGGMILSNDAEIAKKINSAIFPGLQGGPLMHVIAGKAVAFKEALQPDFKDYAQNVVANAQTLAKTLLAKDINVLTGGTDCHMILVDLRKQGLTGKLVSDELDKIGITCNKNSVPFDTEKPTVTSGIRLGTPAPTTRGFQQNDFVTIGNLIGDFILELKAAKEQGQEALPDDRNQSYRQQIMALCDQYPIYDSAYATI